MESKSFFFRGSGRSIVDLETKINWFSPVTTNPKALENSGKT